MASECVRKPHNVSSQDMNPHNWPCTKTPRRPRSSTWTHMATERAPASLRRAGAPRVQLATALSGGAGRKQARPVSSRPAGRAPGRVRPSAERSSQRVAGRIRAGLQCHPGRVRSGGPSRDRIDRVRIRSRRRVSRHRRMGGVSPFPDAESTARAITSPQTIRAMTSRLRLESIRRWRAACGKPSRTGVLALPSVARVFEYERPRGAHR
jgi:hypothetical protein